MTGKERVLRIIDKKEVDRCGFWMGHPTDEAKTIYCKAFGCRNEAALSQKLGDDMTWIEAGAYLHPLGRPMWDVLGGEKRVSLGQDGVFAETEDVDEILRFDRWPEMKYVSFRHTEAVLKKAKKREIAIFSGTWTHVWHLLMDFFGMENCFVKMYTDPDVVLAVMKKMTDFYLEMNRVFFDRYGDLVDVFFFGNDMGSQLDCMISPDMFRTYIFPFYRQLIDLAKSYGKKVALHSCGAIDKLIPDIIGMGVDVLHPIQAKASNMGAEHLQEAYGGQIVFLGGVDTQELLPFGSPEDVEKEVLRLRGIFGNGYICSPSHEALLKNVSPDNLLALSRAATRLL